MTEREWPKSGAPRAMLEHCWMEASARKQLFGCACCSRGAHLMNERSRLALRTAERFADGEVSAEERDSAYRGSGLDGWGYALSTICQSDPDQLRWAWDATANTLLQRGAKWHAELSAVADLIRDIFGNPFRPMTFDPAWLTSDVLALARGIYDDRAFDRMPIFADALQDAGCDNEDVLFHCRDANPVHVRGCWVLDLVLGKT